MRFGDYHGRFGRSLAWCEHRAEGRSWEQAVAIQTESHSSSINLRVVYLLVAVREPLHRSSICRVVPAMIQSAHAVVFELDVHPPFLTMRWWMQSASMENSSCAEGVPDRSSSSRARARSKRTGCRSAIALIGWSGAKTGRPNLTSIPPGSAGVDGSRQKRGRPHSCAGCPSTARRAVSTFIALTSKHKIDGLAEVMDPANTAEIINRHTELVQIAPRKGHRHAG
jgi:hypothetical protein